MSVCSGNYWQSWLALITPGEQPAVQMISQNGNRRKSAAVVDIGRKKCQLRSPNDLISLGELPSWCSGWFRLVPDDLSAL
jgi:hypothetical protein